MGNITYFMVGVYMEKLEQYLSNDYVKEKELQKSVVELIQKVIPTYAEGFDKKGFEYQLGTPQEKLSVSTTAMIASSMSILYGKSDLVDYNKKMEDNTNYFNLLKSKEEQEKHNSNYKLAIDLICKEFIRKNTTKKNKTFVSNTYGINDPFTLMWVKNLIDNNNDILKDDQKKIVKKFNRVCIEYVVDIFKVLYEDKNELKYTESIESKHIFPLLKMVQLYKTIKGEEVIKRIKPKHIINVKNTFQDSLHNHLSLASIENSNFDAAELVFSLEGILLLDSNRDNFDKNLLDRVFQVVKERQEVSHYWRPLKPFVSTESGLALLPLSVEIAMSLIRICKLLGKKGEELFSDNFDMFKKYTVWQKSKISHVVVKAKDGTGEKSCYGWCSEHVYQPNVIHPWETSQAMVYLVKFNEMLQSHIAYKSFTYAKLSVSSQFGYNKEAWREWMNSEPLDIKGFNVYHNINENYLESRNCYSMLLYGPPGTGKSTIAEKIAETKGWPLVTITPSDFITGGVDQVETRAKNIFKTLEEQKNMVVLFDEIDRLILDRDSDYYLKQGDIFQFMTPSMLVKLKDLRRKEKIIFVVATNYAERIDNAIKRKGRIDYQFLVLPHDKNKRKGLFDKFILEKINQEYRSKIEAQKQLIIRKTAFYTYNEFEQLADTICNEIESIITADEIELQKLNKLIEKPAISLMNYKLKLGLTKEEKTTQKSIKEFITLVYLKAETLINDDDLPIYGNDELELLFKYLYSIENGIIEEKNEEEYEEEKEKFIEDLKKVEKSKIIIENMKNDISEEMAQRILSVFKKHYEKTPTE
jgi:DNA polymerase III delta prime subunit